MKLKGTKIFLAGHFDDLDSIKTSLLERGAVISDRIERDVECVFVGEGDSREGDDAKELGLRVNDLSALLKALESEEPAPKSFEDTNFEMGEMPDYLSEGPPLDVRFMPAEEESFDFSGLDEIPKKSSVKTSKTPKKEENNGEDKKEFQGFSKGDVVKIIGGKEGVGEIGEVFWLGENKYGPGTRAGVKTEDGKTYWLDENDIGPSDSQVSSAEIEASKENSKFGRGDIVRITGGKEGVGEEGTIFWWGESKFGPGMRAGVEAESGEKYWVDAEFLEAQ